MNSQNIVVKIVLHKNINRKDLLLICDIKRAFGDYSLESQLDWINNNLADDDVHFMLFNNGVLVGYLNIINTYFKCNGILYSAFGIGNVCTIEKCMGYGSLLLEKINCYILKKNKYGLLFCKNNLIAFYSKYNWKLVNVDSKELITNCINTMVLSSNKTFESIDYNERLF